MVVENVPGFWRLCILCTHLRDLLLCQQGKKSLETAPLISHIYNKFLSQESGHAAVIWRYMLSCPFMLLSGYLIFISLIWNGLMKLVMYTVWNVYVLIEKGSTLCPLQHCSGLLALYGGKYRIARAPMKWSKAKTVNGQRIKQGFLFSLFVSSWTLWSSFPLSCTSAIRPWWSYPSGCLQGRLASMQPTCSSGKSMLQWKSIESPVTLLLFFGFC